MNENPDLLQFLGRFHPLLVHLPIGFLVLLVTLESLARTRRFRGANSCAGPVLALLVPAALASAGCGWLLSQTGEYDGRILGIHRLLGFATAALCALVAGLHWQQRKRAYLAFLYLSAIVLAVASHVGGSLTHGSDYLTRYAPAPIKALLGRSDAKARPQSAGSGKGAFIAVVQPVLQARCGACHNAEKYKGGLRVDTIASLMRGGNSGPVMAAGNAAGSPILKRLLLPLDDENHMPPDGKPQPTPAEVAVLRWWIDAGASATAAVDELHPSAEVRSAIELTKKQPR